MVSIASAFVAGEFPRSRKLLTFEDFGEYLVKELMIVSPATVWSLTPLQAHIWHHYYIIRVGVDAQHGTTLCGVLFG